MVDPRRGDPCGRPKRITERNMEVQKRKQIRLANYDYSSLGGYYVTICTYDRKKILSQIVCRNEADPPAVKLSELGLIVNAVLREMSLTRYLRPEKWVIMPDHIHILVVKDSVSQETLGQFVAAFKSIVSNRWLSACKSKGIEMGKLWQRGYFDHVLRNEADYVEKAAYMEANAERWIETGDHKGRPYARNG